MKLELDVHSPCARQLFADDHIEQDVRANASILLRQPRAEHAEIASLKTAVEKLDAKFDGGSIPK